MFGIDEPADGRECILRIDAVAFGNFGGGGNADRGRLGAGNRAAQSSASGSRSPGRSARDKRSDECRLLELVDRLLDVVDEALDARSASNRAISLRASMRDPIGLFLDAPRPLCQAVRSNGLPPAVRQ